MLSKDQEVILHHATYHAFVTVDDVIRLCGAAMHNERHYAYQKLKRMQDRGLLVKWKRGKWMKSIQVTFQLEAER